MPVDSSHELLLILSLPLLLAILVAAAARWPRTFAALSLDAFITWSVLTDLSPRDRLGLGDLLASAFFLGLVVIFLTGLALLLLRAPKSPAPDKDGFVALLVGAPAILLLLLGDGILGRWRGDVAFGLLAACMLLCAQQTISRRRNVVRLSKDLYAVACIVVSATAGMALTIAYFTASIVQKEAEKAAASRPHCIQSGSRAAASMLDLSLLTFREPRYSQEPAYLRNHGLLVIDTVDGPDVMHWSYRRLAFQPGSLANSQNPSTRPEIVCVPR